MRNWSKNAKSSMSASGMRRVRSGATERTGKVSAECGECTKHSTRQRTRLKGMPYMNGYDGIMCKCATSQALQDVKLLQGSPCMCWLLLEWWRSA